MTWIILFIILSVLITFGVFYRLWLKIIFKRFKYSAFGFFSGIAVSFILSEMLGIKLERGFLFWKDEYVPFMWIFAFGMLGAFLAARFSIINCYKVLEVDYLSHPKKVTLAFKNMLDKYDENKLVDLADELQEIGRNKREAIIKSYETLKKLGMAN